MAVPPTLTLSKSSTTRPATLDAVARNLIPGTRVNIRSDGSVIATGRAMGDGTFGTSFLVGTTSKLGTHKVDLRDSANRNTLGQEQSYQVVPSQPVPPPPPPPPPPPVSTAPSVPLSLSGVVGDTVVNLAWAPPASNGGSPVTGYRVYLNGGLAASPTGLTQTFTGLINGTACQLAVSAVNALGEGPRTAVISLTPIAPVVIPPPPPPPVTSIQAALDNAQSGATVTIPAGIYRETVRINKPVTVNALPGAIIDGRDAAGNVVRAQWLIVAANDVTVRGFTMRYAAGTNAAGSVENAVGVQRFVLEDCDIGYSYVLVNLTSAVDSVIRNCSIHDARHLGVRVSQTTSRGRGNQLIGNRIYHNNRVGEPDPTADGGNVKATGQDNLVMDGNEVYDSDKGLWLDVSCVGAIYRNNRVHDNDTCGIHDETSTGSKIYNNACWRNGFGEYGSWGWGAGILVAACKATEVYGNTVAWNNKGISFVSQSRPDDPGMTGNYVHDNLVVSQQVGAGQDHWGLGWYHDWASPLYLPASNNRASGNKFWYDGPENQYGRFIWNGYHTMASFVDVPGGATSTYMSTADKTAALAAAGIPATAT